MSEKSEMWQRFFHGSKYEAKYRLMNDLPPATPADGSVYEWTEWLARLRADREQSQTIAPEVNPFK